MFITPDIDDKEKDTIVKTIEKLSYDKNDTAVVLHYQIPKIVLRLLFFIVSSIQCCKSDKDLIILI